MLSPNGESVAAIYRVLLMAMAITSYYYNCLWFNICKTDLPSAVPSTLTFKFTFFTKHKN